MAELKKVIARLKELQEQIQGHGDVLGISDQEREELMEQLSGFCLSLIHIFYKEQPDRPVL